MSAVSLGTCQQESCKVGSGGTCLEGFEDLKQCPHFLPIQQPDPEGMPPRIGAPEPEESSQMIDLPDGADLNSDSAKLITQASVTRLITHGSLKF